MLWNVDGRLVRVAPLSMTFPAIASGTRPQVRMIAFAQAGSVQP